MRQLDFAQDLALSVKCQAPRNFNAQPVFKLRARQAHHLAQAGVRHDARASARERGCSFLQQRNVPASAVQQVASKQAPHGTPNDHSLGCVHTLILKCEM